MNQELLKRFKSFFWRAGGMLVVAVGAYILQIGDVFKLDWHTLVNLAVIAVVGLAVGEVTKWLNAN